MRVLVMVMLARGRVGTLQCPVVTLSEDERGWVKKAKDSKKRRSQDRSKMCTWNSYEK